MLPPPPIPLSLYIHMPWCIKKCPYCDFNSHALRSPLPEAAYIDALLADLDAQKGQVEGRTVDTLFIGGGTPSLFSGKALRRLIQGVKGHVPLASDAEITLEANPGALDAAHTEAYRQAGINRLSLGIQSFDAEALKVLGRIHSVDEAHQAIRIARQAGFNKLNLDIMYALPNQSHEAALNDLNQALAYAPEHLSWYQLTLEPNTLFHKHPPQAHRVEDLVNMEEAGHTLLAQHGLKRYEVSAYAKPKQRCRHNLNYWQFGDYLGIGAGAHGKITRMHEGRMVVTRTLKHKHPKHYMAAPTALLKQAPILEAHDLLFECMLNTLRLTEPVAFTLLKQRTGLDAAEVRPQLSTLAEQGLLTLNNQGWCMTPRGMRFVDDATAHFLLS